MEEANQSIQLKEKNKKRGVRAFQARWIVPISRPPIENGIIVIDDDKILEVDHVENIQREVNETIDLGNSIVFPGFVNAHTHLEHDIPEIKATDFYSYLRLIRSQNLLVGEKEKAGIVEKNIEECHRLGTIALADFSNRGVSYDPITKSHLFARIFHEISGFKDSQAASIFCDYQNLIKESIINKNVTKHLAPSAPWALSPQLLKEVEINERHIAIHMNMVDAENEFFLNGTGKIKQFLLALEDYDYGWKVPRVTSTRYFFNNHFFAKHNILVHMIHVDESDIDAIKKFSTKVNICFCPRMSESLDMGHSPILMFQEKGLNICIGTESKAAVPDLDMRKEIRFCITQYGVSPEAAIKFATLNGAYAIGFHKEVGSLEPEKTPKCLVLKAEGANSNAPYELIAHSTEAITWLDEIDMESGYKTID